MPSPPPLLPWGRLVLLDQEKCMSLTDHYDLSRSQHCVGRVTSRSDIRIFKHYISGLHCIIRFLGKESNETPLVEIEDQSRYGIWVNTDKVGYRRKRMLKNNDKICFTPPNSKGVTELVYRFEIIPSGLTKGNQDLHARLSAEEMPVAVRTRTRKRTHEETQSTQSPTKVLLALPRLRPVKKMRWADEGANESVSEPACAPATEPARDSSVQVPTARAAKKKRRVTDAPAPDINFAQLQKENHDLRDMLIEKEKLKGFRDENAALKKAHAEELAKVKAEAAEELAKANKRAAAKLAKVKAEAAEELAKANKRAAAKLAKVKTQVAAEQGATKWELSELREERDALKRIIDQILQDPNVPHKVRSVAELEAKLHVLKRTIRDRQDDLAFQMHQERPQMTPSSEKQVVKIRKACDMTIRRLKFVQTEIQRSIDEATEMKESTVVVSSGSSQSQDSIDNGRQHNAHRSSLQLSNISNEHSEPSPGDILQTCDAIAKETNRDDVSQGRPLMFNIYGADSTMGGIPDKRPMTRSRSQLYRASTKSDSSVSQESHGQENDVGDEETKAG